MFKRKYRTISKVIKIMFEDLYQKDPMPVGNCDKLSLLGSGGFGKTHRMIHKVDKGVYAVKVIDTIEANLKGFQCEDLEKEAVILQSLDHPNIVRYITCCYNAKKEFCIVMQLVVGGSIANQIRMSPPIELIRLWLFQMSSALKYLHYEKMISHRDIKPENILVSSDNSLKLIDLGLASVMKSSANKTTVGTLEYFSYEKGSGSPYDGRDDIWAAGCVFVELMTRSRLTEHGCGMFMCFQEPIRSKLIVKCMNVDAKIGALLHQMLEPQQADRLTSEELFRLISDDMTNNLDLPSAVLSSVVTDRDSFESSLSVESSVSLSTSSYAAAAVTSVSNTLYTTLSSFPLPVSWLCKDIAFVQLGNILFFDRVDFRSANIFDNSLNLNGTLNTNDPPLGLHGSVLAMEAFKSMFVRVYQDTDERVKCTWTNNYENLAGPTVIEGLTRFKRLAMTVFRDKLWLAGIDSSDLGGIFLFSSNSGNFGDRVGGRVSTLQGSDLDIAGFNGSIYLCYVRQQMESQNLFLVSSNRGEDRFSSNILPTGHNAIHCSICSFENKLFVCFVEAISLRVNFLVSDDGRNFRPPFAPVNISAGRVVIRVVDRSLLLAYIEPSTHRAKISVVMRFPPRAEMTHRLWQT